MSVIAAALKHMLAANMPHDAILAAVEDMERGLGTDEQAERRRAADRDRQRARRLRISAESADAADGPRASATRVEDKTSNLDIEPQVQKETREALSVTLDVAFDAFWTIYPNKVGKPKARAALAVALRKSELDAVLDGLRRYIASKPADREWLNPATFLDQERWTDQPALPAARAGPALSAVPSMSEMFRVIGERASEIEPRPSEDRSGFRPALSDLRPARTG